MSYQSNYMILLRCTPHLTPYTAGYTDVRVWCAGVLPIRTTIGQADQGGLKRLRNVTDQRDMLVIKTIPHSTLSGLSADIPGYGYAWQLQKYIAAGRLFVMGVYKTGSDLDAGAIPRSRLVDASGTEQDDDFWIEEWSFPWECVLDGELRPNSDFQAGIVDMEFTLAAAEAV